MKTRTITLIMSLTICVGYAQQLVFDPAVVSTLVVNHTANLTWFFSTVAGGIGGRFIPEGALGIDYALIAMFICLLIYQIRQRIHLLTAVIAGITAVVLALLIPGNTYIVIASMMAATAGVIIQRHAKGRRPDHD